MFGKCRSVSKVGSGCAKAGLGCGSCATLIAQLIEARMEARSRKRIASENYYVPTEFHWKNHSSWRK